MPGKHFYHRRIRVAVRWRGGGMNANCAVGLFFNLV